MTAWCQCAWRSRGKIRIDMIHVALFATIAAPIHSLLGCLQRLVYGFRARRLELEDPIFVIGYWRSGTTLLHEYLSCDPRFAFPTLLQCFSPADFRFMEPVCKTILSSFIPKKRPMDDMDVTWDTPQEDEFAMANLGAGSINLEFMLPDSGPIFDDTLEMDLMSESRRRRWFRIFDRFLRHVALYHRCTRLVLKSPQHTARIRHILKYYPDAKFVHISRDPIKVLRSTKHLWQTLSDHHGLQQQDPSQEGRRVNAFFERMYRKYFADRELLGCRQLTEIRYEDLIQDPVATMSQIYDQLGLEGFTNTKPYLQQLIEEKAGYRTNDFSTDLESLPLTTDVIAEYCRLFRYH